MDGAVVNHTLDDVWKKFDELKASHESGSNDACLSYGTVRLVTLLEQFCRIEHHQHRLKLLPQQPRQWKYLPSIQVLADVFQMFDAKISRKECEDKIRLYGKNHNMIDDRVPIGSDKEARCLANAILPQYDESVVEWMWLYTLSFQRAGTITKCFRDVTFTKAQHRDLNRLFGRRNAVVHTMSEHPADKADFGLVESLFEMISPGAAASKWGSVRPRRTCN